MSSFGWTAETPATEPNPFEIPEAKVTVTTGVIPPAAPVKPAEAKPAAPEIESEALKRLKDRSAKARWEQLHQEWLKNRKERDGSAKSTAAPAVPSAASSTKPTPPAAVQPQDNTKVENPFEELTPPMSTTRLRGPSTLKPVENPTPFSSAAPPLVPLSEKAPGEGVRRPSASPLKALLQSQTQEKPTVKKTLPTDEELRQMLIEGESKPLAPAVRDPADLPKITEILPNPPLRQADETRATPEQDAKQYVKLGKNTPYVERSYTEFIYQYEATNVYSNPLYFEDPHLERYGHTNHPLIQPFASIGLFGLQLGGLPYQMAINHPTEKIYPLGWYSPGDYVPYRMRQIPLSLKGAATEAAVIGGVRAITP